MADDQRGLTQRWCAVGALRDLAVGPADTDGDTAHQQCPVPHVRVGNLLDADRALLARHNRHCAHVAILTPGRGGGITRSGGSGRGGRFGRSSDDLLAARAIRRDRRPRSRVPVVPLAPRPETATVGRTIPPGGIVTTGDAVDVVVVGGGPAGWSRRWRAAELGARTALVTRGEFGGMAANDGPVPVRTLAHAARLSGRHGSSGRYGVAPGKRAGAGLPQVARPCPRGRQTTCARTRVAVRTNRFAGCVRVRTRRARGSSIRTRSKRRPGCGYGRKNSSFAREESVGGSTSPDSSSRTRTATPGA